MGLPEFEGRAVKCNGCQRRLSHEAFTIARQRPQQPCKECKAERARVYRRKQGGRYRQVMGLAQEARRRENTERVFDYLATHPCVDCGEGDPLILEFDHVQGVKRAPVANLLRACAWPAIAAEIEKCEVRCANCHRRKTARQLGWFAYFGQDHRHKATVAIRRLRDEAAQRQPLFEEA